MKDVEHIVLLKVIVYIQVMLKNKKRLTFPHPVGPIIRIFLGITCDI